MEIQVSQAGEGRLDIVLLFRSRSRSGTSSFGMENRSDSSDWKDSSPVTATCRSLRNRRSIDLRGSSFVVRRICITENTKGAMALSEANLLGHVPALRFAHPYVEGLVPSRCVLPGVEDMLEPQ